MKRIAAAAFVLASIGSVAHAQEQRVLRFFADPAGTNCEIVNTQSEIVTIHMLLTGDGSTANTVTFSAPTPACWTGAVWLGDDVNPSYLWLGTTHDPAAGLTVTFIGCKNLPIYLGSMTFEASGSEPCCYYDILPGLPATVNQLRIIDCDGDPVVIPAVGVTINPDAGCPCGSSELPVAVEETTWGRVKALYR